MTEPITDAALAEIERLAQEAMGRDGVLYVRYAAMMKLCQMLPAVTARLRAAERAREAEGWRPIETAPRCVPSGERDNGRRPVIVTRYPAAGVPPQAIARLTTKGWISGKRGTQLWFEPTHWRPLPAPPAPRAEVQG